MRFWGFGCRTLGAWASMPLEPKLEEITWIGTFTLRVVFSFFVRGGLRV